MLGEESVPVDYQEYASEAVEWADMVADNKIAELSSIAEHELNAPLITRRWRNIVSYKILDVQYLFLWCAPPFPLVVGGRCSCLFPFSLLCCYL